MLYFTLEVFYHLANQIHRHIRVMLELKMNLKYWFGVAYQVLQSSLIVLPGSLYVFIYGQGHRCACTHFPLWRKSPTGQVHPGSQWLQSVAMILYRVVQVGAHFGAHSE